MAIPIVYNLRSVRARWVSAIVAVLGIAGTVGVFVAMLALAHGFQQTLVSSGSPDNAIIRRAGATGEIDSIIDIDQVHALQDKPGIVRVNGQPLMVQEVVVIAGFPLKATGTDANVQVRGTSPEVLQVRQNIHMARGRFFQPGLSELVVGKNSATSYTGFDLGSTVKFGGGTWTVVGVFDAGNSAFDSEVWCDARILESTYQRPPGYFQSLTARLTSPDAFGTLKDAITADPKLTVQVEREREFYERQSRQLTLLIETLGYLIATVMGIGAVFGALNTMYSAVADRSREIATMRALGFGAAAIVVSFVFEAMLIAAAGGALGCLSALPVNGLTTGVLNFQTFSHVTFAFQVTPAMLGIGIGFALFMGIIGGVPPAIRAARRPITLALRDL